MRSFPLFLIASLLCWQAIAPAPAAAQYLHCNPCRHAFGDVPTGTSVTSSVQIWNRGTKALRISSASVKAKGFSLGSFPLPMTIQPEKSVVLRFTFRPTTAGFSSGYITIASNAVNSPLTVHVAGTGVSSTTGSKLAANPSTLNFGNVAVASSSTLSASLTASGGAVKISSAGSSSSQFAIVGLSLPVTIQAGQSLAVKVRFTPKVSGTTSGKVTFASNATNSPTIVQVAGAGVSSTGSNLAASPSTLNFGSVAVGSSATLSASLNASGGAVKISSDGSNSSEFAIVGLSLPVTIQAGQTLAVKVRFTPNASGTASGKVGFTSNAVNSPTVVLVTGAGVASGSHSVTLTWNPGSSNAVGFNIYRGTAKAGPFHMINTALHASTNYTDFTVVSGATYYYVTTEVNAQGQESGYSNVVQAVIPNP